MNNKNIAIYAFAIAQFTSVVTIIVGNYGFFHFYIKRLKTYRNTLKKNDDDKEKTKRDLGPYFENMNDFPFTSIVDMVPGVLENSVRTELVV